MVEDVLENNYVYLVFGVYDVELEIIDENGCVDVSMQVVSYFFILDLIVIVLSEFQGCVFVDIFFDNFSFFIDDIYDFDWDFGDGNFGIDLSFIYLYEDLGFYIVLLVIISLIGCIIDIVFQDLILMELVFIVGFSFLLELFINFDLFVQVIDELMDGY